MENYVVLFDLTYDKLTRDCYFTTSVFTSTVPILKTYFITVTFNVFFTETFILKLNFLNCQAEIVGNVIITGLYLIVYLIIL